MAAFLTVEDSLQLAGGIFNRKHGRALQKAFEDRSEADYQDYAKLTKEQIQARIDEASDLITGVKDLVHGT